MSNQTFFLTTYTKSYLTDWQLMKKLLHLYNDRIKDIKEFKETNKLKPLTQQLLNDALSGPYQHFFRQKLNAYQKILYAKEQLTLHETDILENTHIDTEDMLSTNLLDTISMSKVNELQKQLTQLTQQHNSEWQEKINEWQTILIDIIGNNYGLSETEAYQFTINEPISELLERFEGLNLSIPKIKSSSMGFSNYLTLKTDLAIHSTLARQHQAHQQSDVNKNLKTFKDLFEKIKEEEQAIITRHKTDTEALMQPVNFKKGNSTKA